MSLNVRLDFELTCNSDGTSLSFDVDVKTAPLLVNFNLALVPSFSFDKSIPTDLLNLSSSSGTGISATINTHGIITFVFTAAPGAGLFNITGKFVF